MFLTTNRASTIDPAFVSRVHLQIHYPQLDESSRLQVWRNFLSSISQSALPYDSNLSNAELKRLAKTPMNGREIKNIVKTALLIAKQKKRPLGLDDVELVLDVKMNNSAVSKMTNKRRRLNS